MPTPRRPRTLLPDAPDLLGATPETDAQAGAVAGATAPLAPTDPLAGLGDGAARLAAAVAPVYRRLIRRYGQGVVVERETVVRGDGNAVVDRTWAAVPGVGTSDPAVSVAVACYFDTLAASDVRRRYGEGATVTTDAYIAAAPDGTAWDVRQGDRLHVLRGRWAGRAFRVEKGAVDAVASVLVLPCREVPL